MHWYLMAMLFFASAANAAGAPIEKLAWLGGCWASDGGEKGSGEQWMPLGGGSMLGMSRTVKNGKTVATEFMQIRSDDTGAITFTAMPSGQATATFPLLRISEDEVVFENPTHDFPQRIAYQRVDAAHLRARIEGGSGDTAKVIAFPMQRIRCEPDTR